MAGGKFVVTFCSILALCPWAEIAQISEVGMILALEIRGEFVRVERSSCLHHSSIQKPYCYEQNYTDTTGIYLVN